MKSVIILGRQPALGLAELESLFGPDKLRPAGREAALLDFEANDVPFGRLGGSVKLARVLTSLDTTSWSGVEAYLAKTIPDHLQYVPEGKFRLGLSAYGLRVRPQEINATGLRLKKIIRAAGRSVRIVPNKSIALNSAQVLHNQLTSLTGWELLAVRDGNKTILAQTFAEQDIEAYAARDQKRPMRDARVGMLPPKLAQVLINLATGKIAETRDQRLEIRILDPFCGTGVLLQEALLMGFDVYGTDLEPRMIDYAQKNLDWLQQKYPLLAPIRPSGLLPASGFKLEVGDATKHTWQHFEAVACETYLGKPLASLPPRHILEQIQTECDDILEKFLQNIGTQLTAGSRLCLAVPAWNLKPQNSGPKSPILSHQSLGRFLHLKMLDHLEEIGYNRIKFRHARTEDLIYYREDQVVARELVVLEKIGPK